MSYSHRDRRAQRYVWRLLAGVGAATVGLSAAAMLGGAQFATGLGAVVALGVVGAVSVATGVRAIDEYAQDLQIGRHPGGAGGLVRAEVRSAVGFERPVGLPSRRSPNVRPPAGRPPRPPTGGAASR